jgi:arylsulfatase A-like enzyme
MNIICLVVDRLHVGYLGCYGNCWIVTPELDRLASESFVFDQALIDSPRLEDLYHAWWRGGHAAEPKTGRSSERLFLPQAIAALGINTTLFTDEPWFQTPNAESLRQSVAEVIHFPSSEATQAANEAEETHFAGYFATAMQWLEQVREPFCLWMHSQGMAAPWDAPLEYRNQYADEDEALPTSEVQVPRRILPTDYHPDELLSISQAYAGQVSLLDLCVGGLLEQLRESPLGKNTLFVLASARGIPLGEHRQIGAVNEALHCELIQVPWLMRFPDGMGAAARSQALVQPADLYATLFDSLSLPVPAGQGQSLMPVIRGGVETIRDRVCCFALPEERAIRTPAWHLRISQTTTATEPEPPPTVQLYTKPDDRWEMNDVANRCSETVEPLTAALAEFERKAQDGDMSTPPPLGESLVSEFR